jgi:homoserine kinase
LRQQIEMNTSSQNDAGFAWRVTVPASSANLGCAFDCGGLALKLYLNATFIPSASQELTVQYSGKTPERVPLDDFNLVLRALRMATNYFDSPRPGGRVFIESEIPVGVGLGSSAAAVIAGLLLGSRYCNQELSPAQILHCAEELEGHVDNAAAAYYGGMVFALSNNHDQVLALKTNFPEQIKLIVVTPSIAVATHKARHVLPESYSRADVVHTLQRAALLAATCFSGKFELFPQLFDDRLHQPYRQELVPGIARSLHHRQEGLLGVAISGSGSSVIAFAEKNQDLIAGELQEIFAQAGVGTQVLFTWADNQGAAVTRELQPLSARGI